MDSGITVIGAGRAAAAPDLLRIMLGVGCDADNVADAVDAAGGRTAAVTAALREHGVGDSDLQTTSVQVHPRYMDHPGSVQGYRASHSITVRTKDLDGFGRLLTVAVDAAGNDLAVDHVGFDIADKSALLVEAREAAFDDARARAAELARLAGRELGTLEAVEESPSHGPIVFASGRKSRNLGMAAEIGLEPGDLSVEVMLNVRWAWA